MDKRKAKKLWVMSSCWLGVALVTGVSYFLGGMEDIWLLGTMVMGIFNGIVFHPLAYKKKTGKAAE